MSCKILVMGLPGAGKTTLSRVLASRLGAVHFDADQVRAKINKDLGFTLADRIEQARRMGWLCDQVTKGGGTAIADFVCPTAETRRAFVEGGNCFVVWVDRIKEGRFPDTNDLFEAPLTWDCRVYAEGSPEFWADKVIRTAVHRFDPKMPTALFLGRYQPFHDAHRALIVKGIERVGQACIAVRDTSGTDEKNPFDFPYVKSCIENGLREHAGRFIIVQVPNITHVLYGRDVGYAIERVDLEEGLETISATTMRARMADGAEGGLPYEP